MYRSFWERPICACLARSGWLNSRYHISTISHSSIRGSKRVSTHFQSQRIRKWPSRSEMSSSTFVTPVPLKAYTYESHYDGVFFFFCTLAERRQCRDHCSTEMNRNVQSSHPSRQSVNSVREISRAPTTSVDTTSRITLQAIKLGARFSGSMKLE